MFRMNLVKFDKISNVLIYIGNFKKVFGESFFKIDAQS